MFNNRSSAATFPYCTETGISRRTNGIDTDDNGSTGSTESVLV